MIVGTAGHVDHGKTALVRALTGTDTDRLKEEKARGISIDLGFAYLPLADDRTIGFVDVPGHERFVATMAAGATGIDAVLLCVAADEGVKPQTREHVQIIDLLGVRRGLVALTRADKADTVQRERAAGEVRELLWGTCLGDAPILPVSSLTGEGVDALRGALLALPDASREPRGHFRLAIDRSFTLAGAGTVVTGYVHAGRAEVGDILALTPGGTEVRVRGIHALNRAADTAQAGQRCALNITGIHHKAVSRGQWLVAPDVASSTTRFDASLRLLAGERVRDGATLHLHLGAAHVMARVTRLDHGLARLTADRPLGAVSGDSFILRDGAGQRTLGGGAVLDPAPPQRGARRPERLALLHLWARDGAPGALAVKAEGGVDLRGFARCANWRDGEAQQHVVSLGLLRIGGQVFTPQGWSGLQDTVTIRLAALHEAAPEETGVEGARLHRAAARHLPAALWEDLVETMLAGGTLRRTGRYLHLPTHTVAALPHERDLWARMEPLLAAKPFMPPRAPQLALDLSEPEDRVRRMLNRQALAGVVVKVNEDHFFTSHALSRVVALVGAELAAQGGIDAARLRDLLQVGRRWVIHLLEFLDAIGYTRRDGNVHRLRDASVPARLGLVGKEHAPGGAAGLQNR